MAKSIPRAVPGTRPQDQPMGREIEISARPPRLPERIEPPQAFANPVPTGESLGHQLSLRESCLSRVVPLRLRPSASPFGHDSHPAHDSLLSGSSLTPTPCWEA